MKGRKPAKASSPWWGNELRLNAGLAAPSSTGALDPNSLPKLGQQPPKSRTQTPQPTVQPQAPPHLRQDASPRKLQAGPVVNNVHYSQLNPQMNHQMSQQPVDGPHGLQGPSSTLPLQGQPQGVQGMQGLQGLPQGLPHSQGLPQGPQGGAGGPQGLHGPQSPQGLQGPSHGAGQLPGGPNRVQLHVPYLDEPPNKATTLVKTPQRREPVVKPTVAPADKYGLKPLLEVLKADSMGTFSPAVGTDIPPFTQPEEQVSKSFASPWAEASKHCVVPDYKLPECYVVNSVVPQQQKLQNLTEETLFYIFYTMPRDAMQEAAAVELTNRNWRYHKDLKLWLTKDPLSEPVQQNQQAESGVYVFFDPSSWEKVKKEYILYYPDIA